MSKGPWEERVGRLLRQENDFVWSFKPPDSQFYGGQPRLDWLACDKSGTFWAVEVKQIPVTRKSFNLDSPAFISPGQIQALDAVARASTSIALLVVGRGSTMYVYDWRRLRWIQEERQRQRSSKPGLIGLDLASFSATFTRWKTWEAMTFREQAKLARQSGRRQRHIPRTQVSPVNLSPKPARSALTSKRTASTRIVPIRVSKVSGISTVKRVRKSAQ